MTKKSIKSIMDSIAKKNSVFSNKRYLDSLFLPSSIIGRQKQAEEILKHVESVQLGFVVPLISVYGRSGSGKSTVVKFVCQNIQGTISFAFTNLRKSKTISRGRYGYGTEYKLKFSPDIVGPLVNKGGGMT